MSSSEQTQCMALSPFLLFWWVSFFLVIQQFYLFIYLFLIFTICSLQHRLINQTDENCKGETS